MIKYLEKKKAMEFLIALFKKKKNTVVINQDRWKQCMTLFRYDSLNPEYKVILNRLSRITPSDQEQELTGRL